MCVLVRCYTYVGRLFNTYFMDSHECVVRVEKNASNIRTKFYDCINNSFFFLFCSLKANVEEIKCHTSLTVLMPGHWWGPPSHILWNGISPLCRALSFAIRIQSNYTIFFGFLHIFSLA